MTKGATLQRRLNFVVRLPHTIIARPTCVVGPRENKCMPELTVTNHEIITAAAAAAADIERTTARRLTAALVVPTGRMAGKRQSIMFDLIDALSRCENANRSFVSVDGGCLCCCSAADWLHGAGDFAAIWGIDHQ